MNSGLLLSPKPWRLEPGDGRFAVGSATVITAGPDPSASTLRSAASLNEALDSLFDLTLPVNAAAGFHRISFNLVKPQADDPGPEGYVLRIAPDGVTITSSGDAGLYYGAQTLIQIARSEGRVWPELTITDRPAVPNRGFLVDITRGKVHSIDALESLIKTFAHFKCNHLQLYTEHAFDFPSYPEIGSGTGALTPEDVRRLDMLCRDLHIELAPNFQSLGHQGKLLKEPALQHLAETPWRFTFATDNDEVFQFLDTLYGDLVPCFTSRLLNVNADEPWDIGRGVSKAMVAERGIGGTYLHHLLQLHKLTTKHGCRMAMWADVLKHHPDLMPQLPDDILLIDWWYESTARYASLDALAASGREFWICAATSSWIALYPRLDNAISNIHDYVEQGLALGANGVLISDWGDNGHDQPLSHSLYPFLWGAECAWSGADTSREEFDAAYGMQVLHDRSGALVAGIRRLGSAMQVERNWLAGWNSAMALYEDPIAGKVAMVSPPEVVAEARNAALALQPLLSQLPDPVMRADLGFATTQLLLACEKVERTRATQALFASIGAGLEQSAPIDELTGVIEGMRRQREEFPALVEEFERRWLASARPSSIQFNLDRFVGLIAQFDRAISWLETQRSRISAGETNRLSLESYDTGGYAVLHEAVYYWIKELEEIIGFDALPEDIKIYLRDAGIE